MLQDQSSNSGGMISTIIMFGAIFAVIALVYYLSSKKKQKNGIITDSELDGKFSLLILNIFAVITALAALVTFLKLIASKTEDGYINLILFISCLFTYASLNALIVLIKNVIQIRRNTEK